MPRQTPAHLTIKGGAALFGVVLLCASAPSGGGTTPGSSTAAPLVHAQSTDFGPSDYRVAHALPIDQHTPDAGEATSIDAVAVHPAREILVVDGGARVHRLGLDGSPLGVWGEAGRAEGKLNKATDIAVDSAGEVVVLEKAPCRLQRFTLEGHWRIASGLGETCSYRLRLRVHADGGAILVDERGITWLDESLRASGTWTVESMRDEHPRLGVVDAVIDDQELVWVLTSAPRLLLRLDREEGIQDRYPLDLPISPETDTDFILAEPDRLALGHQGDLWIWGRLRTNRPASSSYPTQWRVGRQGQVEQVGCPYGAQCWSKGSHYMQDIDWLPDGRPVAAVLVSTYTRAPVETEERYHVLLGLELDDAEPETLLRSIPPDYGFRPELLEVAPDGTTFVSDRRTILRLDAAGVTVARWEFDTVDGLSDLDGMGVDPNGTLLTASFSSRMIRRWSRDGVLLDILPVAGSGVGYPVDVAATASGEILVTGLNGDHAMVRLAGSREPGESHPALLQAWPALDPAHGSLRGPGSVTVTRGGEILAVDGNQVVRFSALGEFLSRVGDPQGRSTGRFLLARTAKQTGDGFVHVPESSRDRIQHFDANGGSATVTDLAHVAAAVVQPLNPISRWLPSDLALTPMDDLLVLVHGSPPLVLTRDPEPIWQVDYPEEDRRMRPPQCRLVVRGAALSGLDAPTCERPPTGASTVNARTTFPVRPGWHRVTVQAGGPVRVWAGERLVLQGVLDVDRGEEMDASSPLSALVYLADTIVPVHVQGRDVVPGEDVRFEMAAASAEDLVYMPWAATD